MYIKEIYFMIVIIIIFFSKVRGKPEPDCSSWWKVIHTLSPLFPLLLGGPCQWDRQMSGGDILFAWAFADRRRAVLQEALTHNGFEIAASGRRTHHSPEYKVWRIQCSYSYLSACICLSTSRRGLRSMTPHQETDWYCLTDINVCRK